MPLNSDANELPFELKRLICKRNSEIRSIELVKKYADRFSLIIQSCNQLRVRLTKLDEHMSLFEGYQSEIEQHDAVTEEMLTSRETVEEEYCSVKAAIMDLLEKHGSSATEDSGARSQTVIRDTMRLPAIPAPSFDGNLQNWTSFIDTFNAMFHNNPDIKNVLRLQYLKASLHDSAAEVIQAIPTTGENYRMAYDTLIDRYENKSLIIQSHIRSLFQTQQVQRPSAVELRKLHHHIVSHYQSLKALHQPVDHWDAWLVTLVCCKLDSITVGEWQLSLKSKDLPTFAAIENFLASRVSAYEVGEIDRIAGNAHSTRSNSSAVKPMPKKALLANQNTYPRTYQTSKCPLCPGIHRLYHCEEFLNQSVSDRRKAVANLMLCFNCLLTGHSAKQCRLGCCKKCGMKHSTTLHEDTSIPNDNSDQSTSTVMYAQRGSATSHSSVPTYAMLSTSIVYIKDASGERQPCRAVLDNGAQLNFITQACAKRLQMKSSGASITIAGVGANHMNAKCLLPTTLSSQFDQYATPITFHTLPVISSQLPSHQIKINHIPSHVQSQLADPQFNKPGKIDCLIGADIFYEVFNGDRVAISKSLTARSTRLGWVITGKINDPLSHPITALATPTVSNQSGIALCATHVSARQHEECITEEHFISTSQRDDTGRFIVRLPLKANPETLGDSRTMAMKRFFNVERRLASNPSLSIVYKAFMKEYIDLGHMRIAPAAGSSPTYYLPHHAVVKTESITTNLRVVFDGSAPAKSGLSLNDILCRGPKVQADIFEILLRFRTHAIVLTADVAKMYRQVLVHPSDQDLQRICYRANAAEPLEDYELCTVTYGTKSASFLATRCLIQLANEETDPTIKRTLAEDFYVDDLISGANTDDECYFLYKELGSRLQSAGFPLRKWCSNSASLMSRIPTASNDPTYRLTLVDEDTVSALGLTWQPNSDTFHFTLSNSEAPSHYTKRGLLSHINRIYDPIGLLTPALIKGKIFLQQLWSLKLGWDSILSPDLQSRWIKFYSSLQVLDQLSVPRLVVHGLRSEVTLHGFSDASQEAYGACIYLRSVVSASTPIIQLFTSKSRVAPMHPTTIPRLELCGALLLAELVESAKIEMARIGINLKPTDITLWTDSTIVLGWIKGSAQLKTFVANRIAQIHDLSAPEQWRHVPTADNPAELISRGVAPEALLVPNTKWWQGPQWLQANEDQWPRHPRLNEELPEIRPLRLALVHNVHVYELLERYSSWRRLTRITAWLFRFKHNTLARGQQVAQNSPYLTVPEVLASEHH